MRSAYRTVGHLNGLELHGLFWGVQAHRCRPGSDFTSVQRVPCTISQPWSYSHEPLVSALSLLCFLVHPPGIEAGSGASARADEESASEVNTKQRLHSLG